jgi:hypothetical protein
MDGARVGGGAGANTGVGAGAGEGAAVERIGLYSGGVEAARAAAFGTLSLVASAKWTEFGGASTVALP